MRHLRAGVLVALAGAALAVPSSALAQIDSLSIDSVSLGPEGASATMTLAYQCDAGWNVAFGSVELAQSSGKRLNRGFGSFFNEFPGVPCTGAPESRSLTVSASSFPFKQGKAAASATLTVFNPVSGALVSESIGPQEVRIRK
jgi:hypothetical protein